MSTRRDWRAWPLAVLVAALFVYSGLRKFGWNPWHVAAPALTRFERHVSLLLGGIQLLGGIGLLFRRARSIAVPALAATILFALGGHLSIFRGHVTDWLSQIVTPLVVLMALAAIYLSAAPPRSHE
ncbi:MAG: DoxX family protein [Candidatus Acidiferrales bacterium]